VQSNEFTTEKVLAWSDAFGYRDGLDAFVGDEAVDTPGGAVESVFGDLGRLLALPFSRIPFLDTLILCCEETNVP
jgi:hypothetical protein